MIHRINQQLGISNARGSETDTGLLYYIYKLGICEETHPVNTYICEINFERKTYYHEWDSNPRPPDY